MGCKEHHIVDWSNVSPYSLVAFILFSSADGNEGVKVHETQIRFCFVEMVLLSVT